MPALTSLKLELQWVGDGHNPDGSPALRTDVEPGLKAAILAGTANVGWGQPVRFNLDPIGEKPNDMPRGVAPGTDPAKGFPVVSWRVRVSDEAGEEHGTAELNADPSKEGEVALKGLPVDIGTRPYDETLGYSILVRGGWKRETHRINPDGSKEKVVAYKPASAGRLKYEVSASIGDVQSNVVPFHCS